MYITTYWAAFAAKKGHLDDMKAAYPAWSVLPVEVLDVPVDCHHGHQAHQQDGTLRQREFIMDNGLSQMRN